MKLTCKRCGHSSDYHRLDDSLNMSPCDPAAPFRCVGPKLDGCDSDCPDFAQEEL